MTISDINSYNQQVKRMEKKQIRPKLQGHQNQKLTTTEHSFINLISLGNCTICKLSLAALILLSFLVVNPQKPTNQGGLLPADTIKSTTKDTLLFGRYSKGSPDSPNTTNPASLKH